jgi:hypothetical protein
LIPGEFAPRFDLHSGVTTLAQESVISFTSKPTRNDFVTYGEHRNDVSAAVARRVGERDQFSLLNGADRAETALT